MGVEARPRRAAANTMAEAQAMQAATYSPALPASPYTMSVVDGAGHMRKMDDLESDIIRTAISRYDGHMSEVARRLGIGRSTLYRKLKEFGLEETVQPDDTTDEERKAG
jgi:DNA-binding NtrC family response regulator